MNNNTGVCTLEFKPNYSDLGKWMCKFTVPHTDEEIGNASLVLLNSIGGILLDLLNYIIRKRKKIIKIILLKKIILYCSLIKNNLVILINFVQLMLQMKNWDG